MRLVIKLWGSRLHGGFESIFVKSLDYVLRSKTHMPKEQCGLSKIKRFLACRTRVGRASLA